MAGKTVLSDEEVEIEVEEDEREEPDGDAVEPEDRDDEDDEEDEEGEDEYEKDGFIVDDVDEDEQDAEEEDRADGDEERQRKKKRKKRESEKNYVLDEDDYELLQDNNIGFRRPKVESKKFKRLKKARADADEGQSGFSDEEEYDRTGKGGRSAEEKLKHSLFGDDEGPPMEDIAEEEEDGDIGEEEDEMADFIVDEEESLTQLLSQISSFNHRADNIMDYKMKKLELERKQLQLELEKRFDKDFEFFIAPHDHLTGDILRATLAKKERIRKLHNF